MKKIYLKPDAEFISLIIQESLTAGAGGAGEGNLGASDIPPEWDNDEF